MAEETKAMMAYVPAPLRPYVHHHYEDFYVSPIFDPGLCAMLMYEGFLPIATEQSGKYYLLPKLHKERCLIALDDVHISKKPKQQSKKYNMVLNRDFDAVVAGCHAQHGIPWLYPPMVALLRALFEAGTVISVECYQGETLAAGELGYAIGSMYTSLTGFAAVKGAGSVQLLALAGILQHCGFQMWDMGMALDYKFRMGARVLPRQEFIALLHQLRTETRSLRIPTQSARDWIDQLTPRTNRET